MKTLRRILFFLSFILLYVIVKELLEIYMLAKSLHPIAGFVLLIVIVASSLYFIFIPILKIMKMPKAYEPTKNKDEIPQFLRQRIDNFRKNDYLSKKGFDFSTITYNEESYNKIIDVLQIEVEKIREKYVAQLFYSSSVSQNGFFDAILIFSSSVNLVKDIFILYNGRVSNKDLYGIAKKVYYSIAIGGSEGVEYATEEIMSHFTAEAVRSIPFIDKIVGSITDGFINAVLLTRIALITENNCKLVYIESDKSLYPSPSFIVKTAKHITGDIFHVIGDNIALMAKDKIPDFAKFAVNPANYVLSAAHKTSIKATNTVGTMIDGVEHVAGKVFSPLGNIAIQAVNIIKKRKNPQI